MGNVWRSALACGLLLTGIATPAKADILFYFTDPGAIQPEENLLFNDPSLTLSGLTVEGITNQTSTILDLTGQESLVADGGQALVSGADGTFTWLNIEPESSTTLFGEFEANLTVYKTSGPTPTGTVTVSVTNNFGATETGTYDVGAGQNFFSLLAVDPQLIRSMLVTSTVPLASIGQIRVGGIETQDITPVPEPGSLLLFGTGLLLAGRRLKGRLRSGRDV